MVFLVLSRRGYEQLVKSTGSLLSPIWVNGGVLLDDELSALRAGGANVTTFHESLDIDDPEQVAGAIETIELHHPGSVVWVEHAALPEKG